MRSKGMFIYGDSKTVSVLNEDKPKAILLGSYLGYNNFGDIIQLKGAINYHRKVTKLEPIIVCDLGSIPDKDFLGRIRSWFGVDAVIFVSNNFYDLSSIYLQNVTTTRAVDFLHLYGGGFLNSMWGAHMLNLSEILLQEFKVKNYVVTGQQIDPNFAPSLQAHFSRCTPRLVGGRDKQSTQILKELGIPSCFSFDDASEILVDWSKRRPACNNVHSNGQLFVHLNTSAYTCESQEQRNQVHRELLSYLGAIRQRFPKLEPVLLNVYSERRYEVRDTLATVIDMEDQFPFANYKVADLAKMALLHDPNGIGPDYDLDMFTSGLGVASSYHTTMFCNILGIPCYLISLNDYYKQKKNGLGLKDSFSEFVTNPIKASFSDLAEVRKDWITKLNAVFACDNRIREYVNIPFAAYEPPSEFNFKEANVAERERSTLWDEVERFKSGFEEQRSLISGLEKERNSLWDEVERFRTGFEEQKSLISGLEKERNSLWDEVGRFRTGVEEQNKKLDELKICVANLEKENIELRNSQFLKRIVKMFRKPRDENR